MSWVGCLHRLVIHLNSSPITSPIATPYECPASPLSVSFFLTGRADGSRAHCPGSSGQHILSHGPGENMVKVLRGMFRGIQTGLVSPEILREKWQTKIRTVEGSATVDTRLLRNHAYTWLVMLASRNDPLPKEFGPALFCDDRINNGLLESEIEWFAGRHIVGIVCKRRCLFSV